MKKQSLPSVSRKLNVAENETLRKVYHTENAVSGRGHVCEGCLLVDVPIVTDLNKMTPRTTNHPSTSA